MWVHLNHIRYSQWQRMYTNFVSNVNNVRSHVYFLPYVWNNDLTIYKTNVICAENNLVSMVSSAVNEPHVIDPILVAFLSFFLKLFESNRIVTLMKRPQIDCVCGKYRIDCQFSQLVLISIKWSFGESSKSRRRLDNIKSNCKWKWYLLWRSRF